MVRASHIVSELQGGGGGGGGEVILSQVKDFDSTSPPALGRVPRATVRRLGPKWARIGDVGTGELPRYSHLEPNATASATATDL